MRGSSITLCASLALTGCGTGFAAGPRTTEEVELANIRPSMIVPNTSPKRLIDTFEKVCFEPSIAAARTALRSLDYAKSRGSNTEDQDVYFADNTRPAVALRPAKGGYDCVLHAQARTGQANAVDRFVAETFPKAVSKDVGGTERLWITPYRNGGNIITKRSGTRPRAPRTYTLGILRPVDLNPPTQPSDLAK